MSEFEECVATFDAALAPHGFKRIARMGSVAWRLCTPGARDCVVSVAAVSRTRYRNEVRTRGLVGYRLRVELETSVRTHFFLVTRSVARSALIGWVYRLRRYVVIDPPAALAGVCAVANDAAWASAILAQADAVAAMAELAGEAPSAGPAASVHFQPNSERGLVHYGSGLLALASVTPERAWAVIDRLHAIAVAAERLPAPSVVVRIGAFGRFSERHPVLLALGLLALALVLLGGAALLMLTLAVAIFG